MFWSTNPFDGDWMEDRLGNHLRGGVSDFIIQLNIILKNVFEDQTMTRDVVEVNQQTVPRKVVSWKRSFVRQSLARELLEGLRLFIWEKISWKLNIYA